MVTIAFITFAIMLLALIAYISKQPNSFRVERSINISQPVDDVFPFLKSLRMWDKWSPWSQKDPKMEKTFTGPTDGIGAAYEWSGNKDVGKGRMEIVDIKTNSQVSLKLDFETPFEAHNQVDFLLKPTNSGSRVTWAMHGPKNFMAKLFGLFMSTDRMVGPDFERGLRNLKELAEKPPE